MLQSRARGHKLQCAPNEQGASRLHAGNTQARAELFEALELELGLLWEK